MPHSIFVREIVNGCRRQPQLLAYDIGSQHEAESLVQGIAVSYRDHGENIRSGARWFSKAGKMFEIYSWPQ